MGYLTPSPGGHAVRRREPATVWRRSSLTSGVLLRVDEPTTLHSRERLVRPDSIRDLGTVVVVEHDCETMKARTRRDGAGGGGAGREVLQNGSYERWWPQRPHGALPFDEASGHRVRRAAEASGSLVRGATT